MVMRGQVIEISLKKILEVGGGDGGKDRFEKCIRKFEILHKTQRFRC